MSYATAKSISPSVGSRVIKTMGMGMKLAPPIGMHAVGSFRHRVDDGGVFAQFFFPANAESLKHKIGLRKRRLAYRPETILGIGHSTNTNPKLWKLFMSASKHMVPDFAPESSDISTSMDKFPVIIFCHGLMGNSDVYSKTCADLASQGYIVIALEHEDGSGCHAACEGEVIQYKRPNRIEYNPPGQTMQPRDAVLTFRAPFLAKRLDEVRHVVEWLDKASVSSQHALAPLIARMDRTKYVLAGHSFGALSTINIFQHMPERFACGILFDIWPFAMEIEKLAPPSAGDGPPVLVITTEEFARNNEAEFSGQYVQNFKDHVWCSVYIKGSVHLSFGDATYWLPNKLSRKHNMQGSTNRVVVQKLLIDVTTAFLNKRLVDKAESAGDLEESILKLDPNLLDKFQGIIGEGVSKTRA